MRTTITALMLVGLAAVVIWREQPVTIGRSASLVSSVPDEPRPIVGVIFASTSTTGNCTATNTNVIGYR